LVPCLLCALLPAQAPLRIGAALPDVLDLGGATAADWLPGDPRDPAQVEASHQAWATKVAPYRGAGAVRILLPGGADRVPMLLAAAQALHALDPSLTLLLAFDPKGAPIEDETAWGAVQGGALLPDDLGPDPALWRERLMAAQTQFPGRPWTLWLPADPGPQLAELMGDGGRLVAPPGGPAERLAALVPPGYTEVEGGLGDLTLRRPGDAQALRWRFQAGAWSPAPLPAERHAVSVTAQETYEVGALLARMRAALVADRRRFRTLAGRLDVDLHIQADQGPGADLGYTFTFFEKAGEPEEVLQKQVRFNGVEANLGPGLQLPIIESRAGLAPPVALGLTEHYRYRDGGSGGPGLRRIRFEPVDADPLLFRGELLVREDSGRVVEERSERSGLPGIVKSEQRTLTYGDAGGPWRMVKSASTERWLLDGRTTQVQRTFVYSDFRVDDPGFESARQAARASSGTMMQQTVEGIRYFNKQKSGERRTEEHPRTAVRAIGGLLLVDPTLPSPVLPLAGFFYTDLNAFQRDIQVSLLTALVYNLGQVTVPLGGGFDASADTQSLLLTTTDRPIVNGRLADTDAVGRRTATLNLGLGRDLVEDFRLEGQARFRQDSFCQAPQAQYRSPQFVLPPSGVTRELRGRLSWQRWGVQLAGYYGQGQRPDGVYGDPGALQAVPDQGRFRRWGASAGYDYRLPVGAWVHFDTGWAGGRGFDRFQALNIGGVGGDVRIAGLRTNAISAERMNYAKAAFVFPSAPSLRVTTSLDYARFQNLADPSTRSFTGLGVAGDLPGFWWFTLLRVDMGVGLLSDMPGVRSVNGFIAFLRVF
jgi:hypothetical protein